MDPLIHPAPEEAPEKGWILYDGDCSLCTGLAGRFGRYFHRRGFAMSPLQTPWVCQRLGTRPEKIPDEMKLLTAAGELFGGHVALAQIARRIWWTWIFFAFSRIPGMDTVLRLGYRWIASRRHLLRGSMQSPPSAPGLKLLRYGISFIWLFHGLFSKILGLIPRHQQIVARILGGEHSWLLTKSIGVGEIMIAIWMASGLAPRRCAATQTLLLIGMNCLEIAYARDLLLAPGWMVGANILLVTAAWIVALRSRDKTGASASCTTKGC